MAQTFAVSTRCWMNCDHCGEPFGEDLGLSAAQRGVLIRRARANGWRRTNNTNCCPNAGCMAKARALT